MVIIVDELLLLLFELLLFMAFMALTRLLALALWLIMSAAVVLLFRMLAAAVGVSADVMDETTAEDRPHAFSSVKISVKKPGSELIRNMLPLSRFTISRHLMEEMS